MSGLVGYGSSDEEDSQDLTSTDPKALALPQPASSDTDYAPRPAVNGHTKVGAEAIIDAQSLAENTSKALPIGPSLGPVFAPEEDEAASASQSPYSTSRALIRDLTLPIHPNLDIPPSPPGSPPSGMNEKFGHFLELKKQGIHYNEKLAQSSALKNPSLLKKLMDFAGLDERDQYETAISKDVWNPTAFPDWAYKEELAKSQQEILKRKEAERARTQRESVEFISASASMQAGGAVRPAAPGGKLGIRGSAAERVMAGLDRERLGSPRVSHEPTKTDSRRREGRDMRNDVAGKGRSRSPSR